MELILISIAVVSGGWLAGRFNSIANEKPIPQIHSYVSALLMTVLAASSSLAFLYKSHIGLAITIIAASLLQQTQYVSIKNHRKGILHSLKDGVVTFKASGKIQYINPAAERLLGKTLDQVINSNVLPLFPGMEQTVHTALVTHSNQSGLGNIQGGFILLRVEAGVSAATWGVKDGFILYMEDVTEYMPLSRLSNDKSEVINKEVRQLIYVDHLTNAFNRRYFELKMPDVLIHAMSEKSPVSFLFLDVDYFKEINNKYGHAIGDMALKHVADNMRRVSRKDDLVFRLGGDEFALILVNTPKEIAMLRAQQLCSTINKNNLEDTKEGKVRFTISIGLAMFPSPAITLEQLLLFSDKALYHAKTEGRNCVRDFGDIP